MLRDNFDTLPHAPEHVPQTSPVSVSGLLAAVLVIGGMVVASALIVFALLGGW